MTASAMLVHPEFFKVGVAMTGPHDPLGYYREWAERYCGLKDSDSEKGSFVWENEPEGNLSLAPELKGKLLLIHGGADDNVHPLHLDRMAAALLQAGKRFDMFLIPGADHSLGDWRYTFSLAWDYFGEHLIGGQREGAETLVPMSAESPPHPKVNANAPDANRRLEPDEPSRVSSWGSEKIVHRSTLKVSARL